MVWPRNKPHFIKPLRALGLFVTVAQYTSNKKTKWENKVDLFYKSVRCTAIIQGTTGSGDGKFIKK